MRVHLPERSGYDEVVNSVLIDELGDGDVSLQPRLGVLAEVEARKMLYLGIDTL